MKVHKLVKRKNFTWKNTTLAVLVHVSVIQCINVNNHHSTGAASGGERHSCAEFCPRPDSLWSQMDSGADSLAVKISRMA